MIRTLISLVLAFVLMAPMTACAAEQPQKSVTEASAASMPASLESEALLHEETLPAQSTAFTDVPVGAWYEKAADFLQKQGYISGTTATTFSPEISMTRGMLVTVLYQVESRPTVTVGSQFSDVRRGAYYEAAVAWAAGQKIVSGYGNGSFGPDDPITREQTATILWQYAGRPAAASVQPFADNSAISGWARNAVAWAKGAGVVSGRGSNRFVPKSHITRAEVCAMLYQYLNPDKALPESPEENNTPVSPRTSTLIVYFSATNTTKALASFLEELTNADLYEIVPQEPYTEEDLAYYTDCRADREQNDPAARPAIAGPLPTAADYDVIFLGYPIWHGQAPKIIDTFLEGCDLTGKTIIPFCTSHSSGIGSSDTNLHPLAQGADWLPGKRFAAGTKKDELKSWIDTLELPEKPANASLPYDGVYSQHEPYGKGVGAMPGRVVWSHDPASVNWDGSGFWWELNHFDETAVQAMVDDSIASLGGKSTAREGWRALFQANRKQRGKSGGYSAGQKIAIKANINGSAVMDDDTSGQTDMSYTNPVLLKALLTSLVKEAGVAPADITVYDVSRLFPDYLVELCTADGLNGVSFVGRNNGAADESAPIQWSYSFSGRVNYLPTCVTEAEYMINLANLKGHSYGITLCGKNHFGSFINGNAMRPPEGANLHQWLTKNEMGIYSPLVDLMANAELGGKTVLYMLDALICAPSEGASISKENSTWQQAPFHDGYTASVFVSQDPVAIDSVGADFLMNEPAVTERNGALRGNATVENYLHEAGKVSAAPSGTMYTDSKGHAVSNLGVHEHWNNSTQKQYSRNLGKKEGIELIQLLP